MPKRQLIAHTDLSALAPRFAQIRAAEGIREQRSAGAVAEAAAGGGDQDPSYIEGERYDLTDVPFVTIDPQGSTDLDQALLVEPDGGGWRVRYAIADVAAHVAPGGALDKEAWERVETVYCPDLRIGLHPERMAEGFASLLQGQRTKAAVWDLRVDSAGELTDVDVRRAWVRSRRTYSYEELTERPPREAAEMIAQLTAFGAARRQALAEAGAVTLPKPSQEVERDGEKLRLEFRVARPIEEDNAQVSLLTGAAAARLMLEAGVGVLRTMPPAASEAIERLRRQADAIGVRWDPKDSYAQALTHLDRESPQTAAFLTAAVSLFRGAAWQPFDVEAGVPVPEPVTHGALAAPYAHVTAPLRRLVDRYGTEVCLAHVADRAVPEWARDALPLVGEAMAAGVRKGNAVDRACLDAVESAVMEPYVGDTFDGVGLDRDTVQLREPAVIARCHGEVEVGSWQAVRLVSADPEAGPRFETVA